MVQPADVALAQAGYAQAAAVVAKDQKTLADDQKTKATDVSSGAAPVAIASDDAQIAATTAQLAVDQALADIAKQTLRQLQSTTDKFIETASISVLAPGPDPTARYVADINHKWTRDDNVKFSVVNGLLSSSSETATDQSPAIAQAVADAIIAIASLGGVGIPLPGNLSVIGSSASSAQVAAASKAGLPSPPVCDGYDLQTTFDPVIPDEVTDVIKSLNNVHSSIALEVSGLPDVAAAGTCAHNADCQPQAKLHGLAYRVATTVGVTVRARNPAPCPLIDIPHAQTIAAIVPDTRSHFIVEPKAGALTTSSATLSFSNGMLTDYSVVRPSEGLASASIPYNIVQDLFKIPTNLLQLRVNYDTQAAAAISGDAGIRKAQIDQLTTIIDAQTKLRQSQLGQPAATIKSRTDVVKAQSDYLDALQTLAKAIAAQKQNIPPSP